MSPYPKYDPSADIDDNATRRNAIAASRPEVEGVETPGNLSFDTPCLHGIPLMVACKKCADAEISRLRARNERLRTAASDVLVVHDTNPGSVAAFTALRKADYHSAQGEDDIFAFDGARTHPKRKEGDMNDHIKMLGDIRWTLRVILCLLGAIVGGLFAVIFS